MMRKIFAAALLTHRACRAGAGRRTARLKIVSVDVEGGGGTLFVTPGRHARC